MPIADFDDKFLIGYGSDLAAVTWDERSDRVSKLKMIENVDPNGRNVISDGKISPTGILFVGAYCNCNCNCTTACVRNQVRYNKAIKAIAIAIYYLRRVQLIQ